MKIRGNVVGTNIRPERNLVKATNLTPEEQARVRTNIGAVKPYVIALAAVYVGGRDEIRILSNFSWDDMVAAIGVNKPIVCRSHSGDLSYGDAKEFTLNYISYSYGYAIFTAFTELGVEHIYIYKDGHADKHQLWNYTMQEDFDKAVERLGAVEDAIGDTHGGLPSVSVTDSGKILRVSSNGIWEAQSLINAEEVAF